MAEQELPSIDIVLDETRRTLDFQFEQLDGLDTKSGVILGIAGVVITLLITALVEKPDFFGEVWLKILVALVVIVLFVSLFLSYRNIRISKWSKPPEIMTLRTDYIVKDIQETKLKTMDTMLTAIKENDKILDRRIYLFKCSYHILFSGLVIVAVGMIAMLITI